jgi:hypothetical protein
MNPLCDSNRVDLIDRNVRSHFTDLRVQGFSDTLKSIASDREGITGRKESLENHEDALRFP